MKNIFKFFGKWMLVFIIVSILAFGIVRMIPVSPVEILLTNLHLPHTEENIKYLEEQWGLDEPITHQYMVWVKNFLRGNWGKSYITKLDLKTEFLKRLPYSLTIGLGGVLLAAVLSFFLGYGAALKNNGFWDVLSKVLSLISQTIPTFILSIVVIYFFGVKYKLVKIFTGNGIFSVLISMLFVAFTTLGSLSRVVKNHFIDEMNKSYIRFYIARGFNPKKILLQKGYKPALYGLLSDLIEKFSWVIGGTTVVEFAFAVPGISYFLVRSIQVRDYLVIQSYIMIIFIWMFFVHLIINTILQMLNVRGFNEE